MRSIFLDARSIFLVIGLIVRGVWRVGNRATRLTLDDSSNQVLAASEGEAEPSETSPATEDTQPETGDPGDGTNTPTSSSTTTTTTAAGSEPATEGTPTSSSTTTTTTTTLATETGNSYFNDDYDHHHSRANAYLHHDNHNGCSNTNLHFNDDYYHHNGLLQHQPAS